MCRYISVLVTVVFLLAFCNIYCLADSSSVMQNTTPPELLKEIKTGMATFKAKHPLPPNVSSSNIRNTIAGMNMKYEYSSSKDLQKIKNIGLSAIPDIADLLVDHDKEIRLKALNALSCFRKLHEQITDDYAETENILILLFRRSLFDNDSEIRRNAVWGLYSIAIERFPNIPKPIKDALRYAQTKDPDSLVKNTADTVLQDLGIIPRDPRRTDFTN